MTITSPRDSLSPPEGLRVVVTGAGSGIGRAIAEGFAASGARVRISDIDEEEAASFGGNDRRSHVVGDAGNPEEASGLIEGAISDFGGLDVIVANAGVAGPTAGIEEISPDDWDRTLAINLRGAYLAAHAGANALRASEGLFIALSSAAGRLGFAHRTPYAASKWGVVGLVKSLALELGPDGVRANAILPGIVEGPRIDRVIAARAERAGQTFEAAREETLAKVAMRRMVTADQIAGACLYLASPLGSAISGQAISVCAGLEML